MAGGMQACADLARRGLTVFGAPFFWPDGETDPARLTAALEAEHGRLPEGARVILAARPGWAPPDAGRPPPVPGALTIGDLAAAILDGWNSRRNAAPQLAEYRCRLVSLLCGDLGVGWHDSEKDLRDAWEGQHPRKSGGGMPAILPRLPEKYSCIQEPFAGYLCYRHADGEQEAAASHLGAIGAQTAELRARWQAYFRDLLIRWPDAAFRTTSWARLRELGLGEPVDEIDFF